MRARAPLRLAEHAVRVLQTPEEDMGAVDERMRACACVCMCVCVCVCRSTAVKRYVGLKVARVKHPCLNTHTHTLLFLRAAQHLAFTHARSCTRMRTCTDHQALFRKVLPSAHVHTKLCFASFMLQLKCTPNSASQGFSFSSRAHQTLLC